MSKTNQILNACNKAYNKGRGGNVQAAINEATKRSVKTLAYCSPCEAEQPTIAKYCCVCGSKNK
jgi:hypothetical protein